MATHLYHCPICGAPGPAGELCQPCTDWFAVDVWLLQAARLEERLDQILGATVREASPLQQRRRRP